MYSKMCYSQLPGGGGETFAIYEKIIEAQVESKNFGHALQTFNKIKKFNLDSMEADNVDYDTPKNKAIELSNFDGNDVLKSYYNYDKYVSTILILVQRLTLQTLDR